MKNVAIIDKNIAVVDNDAANTIVNSTPRVDNIINKYNAKYIEFYIGIINAPADEANDIVINDGTNIDINTNTTANESNVADIGGFHLAVSLDIAVAVVIAVAVAALLAALYFTFILSQFF